MRPSYLLLSISSISTFVKRRKTCIALDIPERSGKQVLGADKPYVTLVVGLEVLLF